VDSAGSLYVADYYRRSVDIFSSGQSLQAQLGTADSDDGPCGLALDPAGHLYVEDFHRSVSRYEAQPSFGPPATVEAVPSTGIATDAAGNLYVDERGQIGVYDTSGTFVEAIGAGSLADAYGMAVSQFSLTPGRLYVAEAATNTVKVFAPTVSKSAPVATINGPSGGFASLRDAAIAVDRGTGEIYVADNRQAGLAERPEAIVDVFESDGSYKGHLKYGIVDATPPGLAVDNSTKSTQGRVYVTSGNSEGAVIYAYPPGAATNGTVLPAPQASSTSAGSAVSASASVQATAPGATVIRAGTAPTVVSASTRHHRLHRHHRRHRGGAR
jgi:hypothetical protein